MIIVKNTSVMLRGDKYTIPDELTLAINTVYDMLVEERGRETALRVIAECGRRAIAMEDNYKDTSFPDDNIG